MSSDNMIRRVRTVYNEYPRQFWILMLGSFIDRMGHTLLFPFLTLYITNRFDVGMTEVGLLFGAMSALGMVGGVLGGALTDRLGRKGMMIYGLLISGFSSLLMGIVGTFDMLIAVLLFSGLVGSLGGPAQQAMVADLLPEEKRAQGFGIWRIVVNICYVIGPTIGGFLASRSYLVLFITDFVASAITGGIVLFSTRETKPEKAEGEAEETLSQTFAGYRSALRDATFVTFIGACIVMTLVYQQLYTTLAVYLRDSHGIAESGFGYLMSINATLVVLLQFPITRWISRFRPMIMMAVGTLMYAVGFSMYGFFSSYVPFIIAMAVITFGEMVVMPTAQALVAKISPEHMRGRYMAVFGFSWVIPSTVGPFLAGLVMDNADPRWVWFACGVLGLVGALMFTMLQRRVGTREEQEDELHEAEVLTPA